MPSVSSPRKNPMMALSAWSRLHDTALEADTHSPNDATPRGIVVFQGAAGRHAAEANASAA